MVPYRISLIVHYLVASGSKVVSGSRVASGELEEEKVGNRGKTQSALTGIKLKKPKKRPSVTMPRFAPEYFA
jgi:hypothetical protein